MKSIVEICALEDPLWDIEMGLDAIEAYWTLLQIDPLPVNEERIGRALEGVHKQLRFALRSIKEECGMADEIPESGEGKAVTS